MRQVTDMLGWLAVILGVAAVVYFTPRLANYVASAESESGRPDSRPRVMAYRHTLSPSATP